MMVLKRHKTTATMADEMEFKLSYSNPFTDFLDDETSAFLNAYGKRLSVLWRRHVERTGPEGPLSAPEIEDQDCERNDALMRWGLISKHSNWLYLLTDSGRALVVEMSPFNGLVNNPAPNPFLECADVEGIFKGDSSSHGMEIEIEHINRFDDFKFKIDRG